MPLVDLRLLWSKTVTGLLQKGAVFGRAVVSLGLCVLITRETSAEASMSTSLAPRQIAEICLWGQKTLSFRKETLSSRSLTCNHQIRASSREVRLVRRYFDRAASGLVSKGRAAVGFPCAVRGRARVIAPGKVRGRAKVIAPGKVRGRAKVSGPGRVERRAMVSTVKSV